jgi:hypothetical protein
VNPIGQPGQFTGHNTIKVTKSKTCAVRRPADRHAAEAVPDQPGWVDTHGMPA